MIINKKSKVTRSKPIILYLYIKITLYKDPTRYILTKKVNRANKLKFLKIKINLLISLKNINDRSTSFRKK